MNKKECCKLYKDGEIPPCAQYLNNQSPIIKNGKLIFRNLNRLFFYISINSKPSSSNVIVANLQISLKHYIIGLFLAELLQDSSKYDKNCKIDTDPKVNSFIHKSIQNPPNNISCNYDYSLILVYSNQDAILNPFSYSIPIKPILFYILFILNRVEGHPGLFFANNDYVTEDTINFILAHLHIKCSMNEFYNNKK